MIVFPRACVDRAATEANDHGQVLDTDRALVFAGAAGCALKDGFLRDRDGKDRRFAGGTLFVQVRSHPECDQLWVELFAGVVGRAMFGTAAALDAGIRL